MGLSLKNEPGMVTKWKTKTSFAHLYAIVAVY